MNKSEAVVRTSIFRMLSGTELNQFKFTLLYGGRLDRRQI
jgi:hypothetical protein